MRNGSNWLSVRHGVTIAKPPQLSARTRSHLPVGVMIDASPVLQSQRVTPKTMTLTALLWLLLPLLAVAALIDFATMSRERRVRMLRRAGLSQSAIAARLGCSRYRVRVALSAA